MVPLWRLVGGINRDLVLVLIAGFFIGFIVGRWTMHRYMMIEKRAIATTIDLALETQMRTSNAHEVDIDLVLKHPLDALPTGTNEIQAEAE